MNEDGHGVFSREKAQKTQKEFYRRERRETQRFLTTEYSELASRARHEMDAPG